MENESARFIGILIFVFGIGYLFLIVGGVMSLIGCNNMPEWLSCSDSWMPRQALDVFRWVFWLGATMMIGGFCISVVYASTRPAYPAEESILRDYSTAAE